MSNRLMVIQLISVQQMQGISGQVGPSGTSGNPKKKLVEIKYFCSVLFPLFISKQPDLLQALYLKVDIHVLQRCPADASDFAQKVFFLLHSNIAQAFRFFTLKDSLCETEL